jgi:hypothetical protein
MKPRIIISKPIALGAIGTILGLVGLAYFFIPSTASTAIEPAAATEAAAQAAYGKFPLSFESNTGQTDSHVKFLARGSGYTLFTLFLSGSEAVLSLKGGGKETRRRRGSAIRSPQSTIKRIADEARRRQSQRSSCWAG